MVTNDTKDNYVSSAKFADIVNDCLWYTFEHLSFKERICVMRVTKRCRNVVSEMIEFQDCLELEVRNDVDDLDIGYVHKDTEHIQQTLLAIFSGQAYLFFHYKLENVESVCLSNPDGCGTRTIELGVITWLFQRLPKMRSLKLNYVQTFDFIENPFATKKPFHVVVERLQSLQLNLPPTKWLNCIINQDNVLEELRFKNCRLNSPPDPFHISELKVFWMEDLSLRESLRLIEHSPHLIEIRIRGLMPPKFPRHFHFIPLFARFYQLKTLVIGFDKLGYNTFDDRTLRYYFSLRKDREFQFSNLELFKLSGILLRPELLVCILEKMPSLKSLKFRNVYVDCKCFTSPCQKCSKLFEQIASLKELRELHVNNVTDRECNKEFLANLTELIESKSLSKLRKLKCTLMDLFSRALFDAFANLAIEMPNESFAFFAPFDDQPNKADLLSTKPRNLTLIHSRCTSKIEFY